MVEDLLKLNLTKEARLIEKAEAILQDGDSIEALFLLAKAEASLLCLDSPPQKILKHLSLTRVNLAALESDKEGQQSNL